MVASKRLKDRDGTIQRGVGRGLRFNPSGSNAGYVLGTSEPGVQRALELLVRAGDVFYDVGANVGYISVLSAKLVGAQGRVVAFEPVPGNVRAVRHNAELNGFAQLSVEEVALAASPGVTSFQLSAVSSWGRLGDLSAPEQATQTIQVQVTTLDEIVFGAHPSPRPAVIKIDVEGAEGAVLAGGERVLRELRPILLIELHGTNQVVADSLRAHDYRAVVLGSTSSIEASPWDAFVIAAPVERAGLDAELAILSSSAVPRR